MESSRSPGVSAGSHEHSLVDTRHGTRPDSAILAVLWPAALREGLSTVISTGSGYAGRLAL